MTEARKGDWIQTHSGRQYWPLDPRPDDVRIEDIAHHLGMLCRFTGACRRFYSVAEHSVHVARVIESAIAARAWPASDDTRHVVLNALMHDAAEAYCNDIARPVKRAIDGYAEIEAANEVAIAEALELPPISSEAWALIKQADNAMLMAEQRAIMAPCAHAWNPENVPEDMQAMAHGCMRTAAPDRWGPLEAGQRFLSRWHGFTAYRA